MIPEGSLLLFDFDGVLADSVDTTLAVSNRVAREYGATIHMTRDLLASLNDMSIPGGGRAMGVPEERLDRFEAALLEEYRNSCSEYQLFDGIGAALRSLSASHLIGIVTNNSEKLVRRFVERHGLGKLVSLIFGQETGGEKNIRIRKAARDQAISLERTYMVGDATSDISEARLAGCKAIAVSWGFQGSSFLEAARPDYLISAPSELLEIFSCVPA